MWNFGKSWEVRMRFCCKSRSPSATDGLCFVGSGLCSLLLRQRTRTREREVPRESAAVSRVPRNGSAGKRGKQDSPRFPERKPSLYQIEARITTLLSQDFVTRYAEPFCICEVRSNKPDRVQTKNNGLSDSFQVYSSTARDSLLACVLDAVQTEAGRPLQVLPRPTLPGHRIDPPGNVASMSSAGKSGDMEIPDSSQLKYLAQAAKECLAEVRSHWQHERCPQVEKV